VPTYPHLRLFHALCGLALLLPTPALAAPSWFAKNDRVEISGIITAPSGQALADFEVVLELVRETRNLRSLRLEKVERDRTPVTTRTDATGSYQLASPWSRYYNRMVLVVGLTVPAPGGPRFQELERFDVTDRLRRGGSAVIPVVVRNAEFVTRLREFLATVAGADEQRVLGEMGRPDRVDNQVHGAERRKAWWYFGAGQVYRFLDGKLTEVERFDPVAPIP
jgi:hypothetical protein